ncbi:hypothetical protein SAMN05421505_11335 [Sinosporangium album]|uniref:DUF6286 domain-containing protein n=1 Tax=Sinosporangium album TaxID=504805 RepID=A0A1G8AX56_9ACTN|nr:DUF6286 domain-containing protein [Sinosporangium album]SDH25569.1 hypothetical protein SAMN05421505_11335 [Sinosporangium album]
MTSAADRAAVHAFRPRRTLPAVLTAALLAVIGTLVAIAVISGALGSPARWIPYKGLLAWASATPWQDPALLVGAAIVTLLGIWLIVLALRPGRPGMVPLHTGDPESIMGMRRRSFARSLAHAAEEVMGIDRAKVTIGDHRADVTAHTRLHDTGELAEEVRQAVTQRLESFDAIGGYAVRVNIRGK